MQNDISKIKMRTKFLFLIFYLCFSFFIFYFLFPPFAEAASFSLEPQSHTGSVGESFDVQLKINTEGEQTTSADVILLYDENILETVTVTGGGFYPQNFKNLTSGKIYVGGAVQNATESKAGEGLLSTITFKGKSAGTTAARFDCTPGKTSDSNISKNDSEATDILDCTKLVSGSYTISGGSDGETPTATPGPTSRPTFGPTCSPTVTPSELPPAGVTLPSVLLLGIGSLLTFLGVLFTL